MQPFYQRIISLSWLSILYVILDLIFLGLIATTLNPFQIWVLFSSFFGSLVGSQFIYIRFPICLFIISPESVLMDLSCLKYDGWPYSKLLLTFPMKAIIDFRKLFHHSWLKNKIKTNPVHLGQRPRILFCNLWTNNALIWKLHYGEFGLPDSLGFGWNWLQMLKELNSIS